MGKELKILLLEDMPADAFLVQRELGKAGVKCIFKVVDNRDEFIESLKNFDPDLVLSDYSLPQFNGLEALEIVQQLPGFMPFIIVTGSINEETAVECIKAGATDYVTKERLIRLGSAVKSALDKKHTIIEKEITEKALMESEEKFRSSFENANVGMVLLNIEGDILRSNPKFFEIIDCVDSNAKVINILSVVYSDDKEKFQSLLHDGIEKNTLQSELEMRFIRSDNQVVWALVSIALINDIQKNPLYFILHIQDVTIRKKALEGIRKLSRSVEQSPVSIIITDKYGDIEYVNPKFSEISGYTFEEVKGQNPRILKSGFLNDEDYKTLWKTISSGNEWSGEFHNKRKDGTLYWESASISPIVDEKGIITHFVGIKEDITEKKEFEKQLIAAKEKAEESDKLKSAFLQNISHEIRTPLNAIKGFTNLLNDPNLDSKKLKYYTDIINNGTDQLVMVIDDILHIASIESGQVKIINSSFNINYLLDTLIKKNRSRAIERNNQIIVAKELKDSDSFIESDESKINQILQNLLTNALKFTYDGKVTIGYTVDNKDIKFFVKDNGIGIAKDMQEKIFERFFQIDNTSTREYPGTGLGLALTKAYVNLLNGEICVESEPDAGATFYFTIPYKQMPEIKTTPNIPESVDDLYYEETKTILVAEDEDNNYYLIEEILIDSNIKLLWAKNGLEAIEMCKANSGIDLVIMDIKMPRMNGYDATREIKSLFPDLPVLALTAYAFMEDDGKAFEAGCSDYISKPLRQANLLAIIKKHIHI